MRESGSGSDRRRAACSSRSKAAAADGGEAVQNPEQCTIDLVRMARLVLVDEGGLKGRTERGGEAVTDWPAGIDLKTWASDKAR